MLAILFTDIPPLPNPATPPYYKTVEVIRWAVTRPSWPGKGRQAPLADANHARHSDGIYPSLPRRRESRISVGSGSLNRPIGPVLQPAEGPKWYKMEQNGTEFENSPSPVLQPAGDTKWEEMRENERGTKILPSALQPAMGRMERNGTEWYRNEVFPERGRT